MGVSMLSFCRTQALRILMFLVWWLSSVASAVAEDQRHAVPKEHLCLFGSREQLQYLARSRTEAYKRVVRAARELKADDHSKMISMALVCTIEEDEKLGRSAAGLAMKHGGNIRLSGNQVIRGGFMNI